MQKVIWKYNSDSPGLGSAVGFLRTLTNFPVPTRLYLEEEGVSQGVAEAEHKVLLGVFGDRLHNAVLRPDGVLRGTVVVDSRATVGLIEEHSASWENKTKSMRNGV